MVRCLHTFGHLGYMYCTPANTPHAFKFNLSAYNRQRGKADLQQSSTKTETLA